MSGPYYAYCETCESDRTFRGMTCRTCAVAQDCLPPIRGVDKTDYSRYARRPTKAPQVSWQRAKGVHRKAGWNGAMKVPQLHDQKTGDHPIVHSEMEYRKLIEKNGLDADTGHIRSYDDGGGDFS